MWTVAFAKGSFLLANKDFEYYSGYEDAAAERPVQPDDNLRTLAYCEGYVDGISQKEFVVIEPPEIVIYE